MLFNAFGSYQQKLWITLLITGELTYKKRIFSYSYNAMPTF